MNEKELAEIKARAEAATPGPWVADKQYPNTFNVTFPKPSKGIVYVDNMAIPQAENDADFIAHARADVPALVSEVERLNDTLLKTEEHCNADLKMARKHIENLAGENAQLRLENARLMLVGFPTKVDYVIRTSNNSNDLEGGEG